MFQKSGFVIPAVAAAPSLDAALQAPSPFLFLLCGDLLSLNHLTARVAAAGKRAFVHIDFVDGLAARDVAVDYVAGQKGVCGLISTRPALLKRARQLGLLTTQRFFILDSRALGTTLRQLAESSLDSVEILPGLVIKAVQAVRRATSCRLIAGGLIETAEEARRVLAAGADYVSTTAESLWSLQP